MMKLEHLRHSGQLAMPVFACPHCQKPFTAPEETTASHVLCPHCQQATQVPVAAAARWYFARNRQKWGPYSWQQMKALAARGKLAGDDMLLQEGSSRWVRADSVADLFAKATGNGDGSSKPKPASRKSLRWLVASILSLGALTLVGICLLGTFLFFHFNTPLESKRVHLDADKDRAVIKTETTKKTEEKPADNPKTEIAKKPPDEKKPPDPPRVDASTEFVNHLNRHRKAAGLTSVSLDHDLSTGCQAHAEYLAKHLDPAKADATNAYDEDPEKDGYSIEGRRAAQSSLISLKEPMAALERWIGRLPSRVPLLNPEIQSIGIGAAKNKDGHSFYVVDVQRGRGEPVIIFPGPNETDVPISFAGGPDVPDAKGAAGFPISVSFPTGKTVVDGDIALFNGQEKAVDGWIWTPEKPLRDGQKLNALGFIAKTLLQSNTVYNVKASAHVNGKPWRLAWTFTTEDNADASGAWGTRALAKVNGYRAAAGLKPVALDENLSRGCAKHARYLVINDGHPSLQGLKAHQEDEKLPGYSKEGHESGKASDIGIGDYEPIDAVDSWMATLYHRVPILDPNLRTIGFGCARGRRQGWATVMNVQSGRDRSTQTKAVFYPAPDQVDVPLSFPNSGEEPNPIPIDKDGRAGYPITATFSPAEPLRSASGKLTDDEGNQISCWFSAPEKPANPDYARNQGTTVCLIPKDPLKPKSTFHVEFTGTLKGQTWEKKWKFTTGDSGLSPQHASHLVMERLNHFRSRAGVGNVELDEVLSRGCQLHAEYLVKNADTLSKSKSSVNDEDPQLPWFTAEGLRSSRQSFVFTNAPTPVMQIDDLMATFTTRLYILDPKLHRVGFGAAHDIGRGWRCVLDPNGGRGDGRVIVYPAPKQSDVPLVGFDPIDGVEGKTGFPITITFPQRDIVRNVVAVLNDISDKEAAVVVSSPEKPVQQKVQRNSVGVHPLAPLVAGQTYRVTVSAIVNGKEWRQSWQFSTIR